MESNKNIIKNSSAIDRNEARRRAKEYAAKLAPRHKNDLVVAESATIEEDKFWVFIINSQAWIEKGNVMSQILTIPPLLVKKSDGSIHELPTAYPPEHYFDQYQ